MFVLTGNNLEDIIFDGWNRGFEDDEIITVLKRYGIDCTLDTLNSHYEKLELWRAALCADNVRRLCYGRQLYV